MEHHLDKIDLAELMVPLAQASTALGRLAEALDDTPLHQAWLWREIAHTSSVISQFSNYRVSSRQLMSSLAGLPLKRAKDHRDLAAARRLFLAAAPLFRMPTRLDSADDVSELFEPLWARATSTDDDPPPKKEDGDRRPQAGEISALRALVDDLVGFAHDGRRPVLLNILVDLRQHKTIRRLPRPLARLALPLALHQVGIVPKPVPGLLGGRLSLTLPPGDGITVWLVCALMALAKEASAARTRLRDLTRQHLAWHGRLREAGLRKHGRAPAVLDLLAITPVLSASLVARHLGVTPQGASAILKQLVDLGLLTEATSRSRFKVYLAGDLTSFHGDEAMADRPLAFSDPVRPVDVDALSAILDDLFADLDRVTARARERVAESKQ